MDWDGSEVVAAIWEGVIHRRVIDRDLAEKGLTGTDSRSAVILGHSRGGFTRHPGGRDGRTAAQRVAQGIDG